MVRRASKSAAVALVLAGVILGLVLRQLARQTSRLDPAVLDLDSMPRGSVFESPARGPVLAAHPAQPRDRDLRAPADDAPWQNTTRRTVVGTVRDRHGSPVAGASIEASCDIEDQLGLPAPLHGRDRTVQGRAFSNESGSFAIEVASLGPLRVTACADGYAETTWAAVYAGDDVQLVLDSMVFELSVLVQAPDGTGAARSRVRLFRPATGGIALDVTQETDGSGEARFTGLPGVLPDAWLAVEHPTFASPPWEQVRFEGGRPVQLVLKLEAGRELMGCVVDAHSRAPVVGAEVGAGVLMRRPVRTDQSGCFSIPGWSDALDNPLRVESIGYSPVQIDVTGVAEVQVQLRAGAAVTGRVVGPDGAPISGAQVWALASRRGDHIDFVSWGSGVSDEGGRFQFGSLSSDLAHSLVVEAVGYGREMLDFIFIDAAQEPLDLGDVTLTRAHALAVAVVDTEGTPVVDAEVRIRGWSATRLSRVSEAAQHQFGEEYVRRTSTRGTFFLSLAPGEYLFSVRPSATASHDFRHHLQAEDTPRELELVIPKVRPCELLTLDSSGARVPNVEFWIETHADGGFRATTGDDGRAVVGLPPGPASVTVLTCPADMTCSQRDGTAISDSDSTIALTFVKIGEARGRIVGPDSRPLAGAWISVECGGVECAHCISDSTGYFAVPIVPDAGCNLVFSGTTFPTQDRSEPTLVALSATARDVRSGDTGLLLRATRVLSDAQFELRILAPDGSPLAGALVEYSQINGADIRRRRSDHTGRVEWSGLFEVPGIVRVLELGEASGRYAFPRPRSVFPSGQTEDVRLPDSLMVVGIVVSAAGSPLGGAVVVAQGDGRLLGSARSDADGRFEVPVPRDLRGPFRVEGRYAREGAQLSGWIPSLQLPAATVRLQLSGTEGGQD